jgi:hypothetical protein
MKYLNKIRYLIASLAASCTIIIIVIVAEEFEIYFNIFGSIKEFIITWIVAIILNCSYYLLLRKLQIDIRGNVLMNSTSRDKAIGMRKLTRFKSLIDFGNHSIFHKKTKTKTCRKCGHEFYPRRRGHYLCDNCFEKQKKVN